MPDIRSLLYFRARRVSDYRITYRTGPTLSVPRDASMFFRRRSPITGEQSGRGIFASELKRGYKRVHTRGNILRRRALRRASRAEQMAGDISGLYRVFPLIFKILYFTQQIVPIEINPPAWADSCCDNSRRPPAPLPTYPTYPPVLPPSSFPCAPPFRRSLFSLRFKVLYSTRLHPSPPTPAALPCSGRCSTFSTATSNQRTSASRRAFPQTLPRSFPPRFVWFSCFLRRSPIFSYAGSPGRI